MKALQQAIQLAEIHCDYWNLDRYNSMLAALKKGGKLTKAEEQDIYSYLRSNRK